MLTQDTEEFSQILAFVIEQIMGAAAHKLQLKDWRHNLDLFGIRLAAPWQSIHQHADSRDHTDRRFTWFHRLLSAIEAGEVGNGVLPIVSVERELCDMISRRCIFEVLLTLQLPAQTRVTVSQVMPFRIVSVHRKRCGQAFTCECEDS